MKNAFLYTQPCDEIWTDFLQRKELGNIPTAYLTATSSCVLSSEAFVRQKSSYEEYISTLEFSNKELRSNSIQENQSFDELKQKLNNCDRKVDKLNEELVDLLAEKVELLRINENFAKEQNEWKSALENQDYGFCVRSCEFIKTTGCSLARSNIPFVKYFITC